MSDKLQGGQELRRSQGCSQQNNDEPEQESAGQVRPQAFGCGKIPPLGSAFLCSGQGCTPGPKSQEEVIGQRQIKDIEDSLGMAGQNSKSEGKGGKGEGGEAEGVKGKT